MKTYFDLLDQASLFEVLIRLPYAQLEKLWEAYPTLTLNNPYFINRWKEHNVILKWGQTTKCSEEIEISTGFKHGLVTVYDRQTDFYKYTKTYVQNQLDGPEIRYRRHTYKASSITRWLNNKPHEHETFDKRGYLISRTVYKDGVVDGLCWVYTDTQIILTEYKRGKFHGKTIKFYKNGQRQNDSTYKEGVRDGRYVEWYQNGIKKSTCTYIGVYRHGKQESWNYDGSKLNDLYFDHGYYVNN